MLRNSALVAVFGVLLSPAAMLAGQKQSLSGGQQAGLVKAILHNASLVRASTAEKADYGTALAWNDTLRTDGNGRVRLKLANGSLSVGSNSEVVFNAEQDKTTSLTLNYGEMRIQPTDKSKFEIRTANAIVTAAGADFAVDATVPGRVRIVCLEGTVQVTSSDSGASSQCDAGEFVTVKTGKAPYQPQLADATMLGTARNITDPEQQQPVQYFP